LVIANCANLCVFAGCSLPGAGFPLSTAIVITMAKIASAAPRCAVMICGGSFQRTVSPPSTIWIASSIGAAIAIVSSARSLRAHAITPINNSTIKILTVAAVKRWNCSRNT